MRMHGKQAGHNILQRRSVLQLRLVQQYAGLPTVVLNVDVLDSMPWLLSKTVTQLHDAVLMHMHHTVAQYATGFGK